MVITVLNLDKCIRDFGKLENLDLYPIIKPATQLVQRTARRLAPVDTTNLRKSIHMEAKKKGKDSYGRIFTNVEYAPYQEFGYSRTVNAGDRIMVYGRWVTAKNGFSVVYGGKPFMRPALSRHRAEIQRAVKGYVKTYINNGGK